MNDIKVPPFTDGQKELIKMTEKLANGRKICDADGIDDDIKDIKEILKEAIAKIENQKQTNFQRITSSPEALAEFISDTCCMLLQEVHVDGGCINGEYDETKTEKWLEWLKQESK